MSDATAIIAAEKSEIVSSIESPLEHDTKREGEVVAARNLNFWQPHLP